MSVNLTVQEQTARALRMWGVMDQIVVAAVIHNLLLAVGVEEGCAANPHVQFLREMIDQIRRRAAERWPLVLSDN